MNKNDDHSTTKNPLVDEQNVYNFQCEQEMVKWKGSSMIQKKK